MLFCDIVSSFRLVRNVLFILMLLIAFNWLRYCEPFNLRYYDN